MAALAMEVSAILIQALAMEVMAIILSIVFTHLTHSTEATTTAMHGTMGQLITFKL